MKNYYKNPRSEMARHIDGEPRRILEIGCAAGGFRRNITWPCEYWGVEPFGEAADAAATQLDRVMRGTFEDAAADLPDAYFDLVVCNDVIEHIADTWGMLRDVRGKLAPGGQFIGSVPNVRYVFNLMALLFARDWRYKDIGIRDRTHLRFFTKRSFRRTLAECGFEVERLTQLMPPQYGWLRVIAGILAFPIGYDIAFLNIAFRARKPK